MTLFILAASGPARADFHDLKQDGDGYYIIATSKDLCDFRDGVNSSDGLLSAKARLTADIDLTNMDGKAMEWTPIGNLNNNYTGIFDGAGHTVKGYQITKRTGDMGFFGVVDSGGTVRGLTVSGDINITDTGDHGAKAGGVAGSCYGMIEDCVNAGSLTVSADNVEIGGIVGFCKYGRISNCVNSGDISNLGDTYARTGGIAGDSDIDVTISNCRNGGNINGSGYTGGVAGNNNNKDSTISNCINGGNVNGGGETGGVVGINVSGTISNCLSSGGTVNGSGNTGGVVGQNNLGTISNCSWLGSSTSKGVGNNKSTVTNVKSLSSDNIKKSVVALSADISEHALNNGETMDISLSTLFGEPNKFGDYVTSIDVAISGPDILSYEKIDEKIVRITAKAKGGTKRATATVTLSPVLCPTDFNTMNPSGNPSEPPLKLTFGITVTNKTKVSGVAITSHDISIYKGESARLTGTVEPPEAANPKVSWSSGDSGIVSVDKDSGEICGIAAGSADITVTTEDTGDDGRQRTDTRTVTVKPVNAASVDISQKSLSIDMNDEGRTYKLTATVSPDNADYGQVVWKSSNEKAAVVSPDKNDAKALTAYVTPVGRGEATITASVGDLTSVPCVVTVIPVWAESVTVSPDLLTLEAGKSAKLSAKVGPEKATDKSVSWDSDDENIATVSENGEVFAHNPGGPVLITATAGGARDDKEVSSSCSLTVTAPPVPVESVTISPEGAAIKVGESFQFTAKILPENADNKGVTWKSGDEKVATVDTNGKVTAVAAGTAAITVTTIDGLKTAEATVSVNRVYSSGSGCAAGVGALALFALVPLWMRRRKR
ncbi:Ig-like domain-containing protein [Cloacibacillus sp.]